MHTACFLPGHYLPLGLFPPSVPGHRVACREGFRAMSIDTLLEAARYLEWQAQQQQITREEEQRKEKELITREAESRRVELVTSSSQAVRANHVNWGNDPHRQQPHPPPPSLPPPQVPIAVIPMVPVVTASPSVPPHTLTTQIAAVTTLHSPLPAKNASSPSQQQQHQLQQQQQQQLQQQLQLQQQQHHQQQQHQQQQQQQR